MWAVCRKIRALPGEVSSQEYPQFVYGSFAGIALTVFALVPSVTNMLGKSALVCVTRAWESGNKASLNANTSQVLLTTAILAMPSAFGIGALSSEILSVLYPLQPDEAAVCVNAPAASHAGNGSAVLFCAAFQYASGNRQTLAAAENNAPRNSR